MSVDGVVDPLNGGSDFDHVLNAFHFDTDHLEDFLTCGKAQIECLAVKPVRVAGLEQFADGLFELFVAHDASVGHGATVWNRVPILTRDQKGFILIWDRPAPCIALFIPQYL